MTAPADYSVANYPSWIRRELFPSNKSCKKKVLNGGSSPENYIGNFVLFVRLPTWKSAENRNLIRKTTIRKSLREETASGEIRTLRNLQNGIEVYKVKGILELSSGLPTHMTVLCDINGKELSDDTALYVGENIKSGSTLHLEITSPYEEIIKSVWKNQLQDVQRQLPHHLKENRGLTSNLKDLDSSYENNIRQTEFCALFLSSSRGTAQICKSVLKYGADPNTSSILGNTALHSATFNGHLDIIQLLVAYGANIRCRNIQGKSPLDLAVASGYMECARWLWLNQWSISITKPSVQNTTQPIIETPQKFTLPQKIPKLKSDLRPRSSTLLRPTPPLEHRVPTIKSRRRPQSTPAIWERSKFRKSLPPNWTPAPSKQAWIRHRPESRGFSPTPPATPQTRHNYPNILPQISCVLTRERSIPSKHETRVPPGSPDFTVGFLHARKPVLSPIYIPLSEATKLSSKTDLSTPLKASNAKTTDSISKPNFSPTTSHTDSASEKSENKVESQQIHMVDKESNGIISAAMDRADKTLKTQKKIVETDTTKPCNDNEVAPILNLTPSAKHNENKEHILRETKKRTATSLADIQSEIIKSVPKTVTDSVDPPKNKPISYSTFERVTTAQKTKKPDGIVEKKQQEDDRQKELRREKSEHAYQEWLASKHREQRKVNQTKQEQMKPNSDLTTKIDNVSTAPRNWEITFEQWLESKKHNAPSKSDQENSDIKTIYKRSRSFENGKTFDAWVKEKRRQSVAKQSTEPQPNSADNQKMEEMRERRFSEWYKNKVEETKRMKREEELREKKRIEEMRVYYDEWKKAPRVKSFEDWKKLKQKDKRLTMVGSAQKESLQCVAEWLAIDRQELAEVEFQKWRLRKESLSLEQAEAELIEAREMRKQAENKARIKRTWLKARAMLNWKNLPNKKRLPIKSDVHEDVEKKIEDATDAGSKKDHLDEGFSEISEDLEEDAMKKTDKSKIGTIGQKMHGSMQNLSDVDVGTVDIKQSETDVPHTQQHNDNSGLQIRQQDQSDKTFANDPLSKQTEGKLKANKKIRKSITNKPVSPYRINKNIQNRPVEMTKLSTIENGKSVLVSKTGKPKRKLPTPPKPAKAGTDGKNSTAYSKFANQRLAISQSDLSIKSSPKIVKRKLPDPPQDGNKEQKFQNIRSKNELKTRNPSKMNKSIAESKIEKEDKPISNTKTRRTKYSNVQPRIVSWRSEQSQAKLPNNSKSRNREIKSAKLSVKSDQSKSTEIEQKLNTVNNTENGANFSGKNTGNSAHEVIAIPPSTSSKFGTKFQKEKQFPKNSKSKSIYSASSSLDTHSTTSSKQKSSVSRYKQQTLKSNGRKLPTINSQQKNLPAAKSSNKTRPKVLNSLEGSIEKKINKNYETNTTVTKQSINEVKSNSSTDEAVPNYSKPESVLDSPPPRNLLDTLLSESSDDLPENDSAPLKEVEGVGETVATSVSSTDDDSSDLKLEPSGTAVSNEKRIKIEIFLNTSVDLGDKDEISEECQPDTNLLQQNEENQ